MKSKGRGKKARLVTIRRPNDVVNPKTIVTDYMKVAEKFAANLARKEFKAAREMLTAELKDQYSVQEFKKSIASMTSYAEGSPITWVQVLADIKQWPFRVAGDVGCVYVGMGGDGFSEAVTVIVTDQASGLMIREIDWGRP